jgi:hypothetical protein
MSSHHSEASGISTVKTRSGEDYPSLRMRGNNLNLRRKSRKKSHIEKSTFVRSGKAEVKSLRPLKSGHPSDIASGVRDSGNKESHTPRH